MVSTIQSKGKPGLLRAGISLGRVLSRWTIDDGVGQLPSNARIPVLEPGTTNLRILLIDNQIYDVLEFELVLNLM